MHVLGIFAQDILLIRESDQKNMETTVSDQPSVTARCLMHHSHQVTVTFLQCPWSPYTCIFQMAQFQILYPENPSQRLKIENALSALIFYFPGVTELVIG